MATVNYRLRSRANKPVSIYIYISLEEGNVISTPSGFTISPKDWSKTTKRPKQNSEENRIAFGQLNKLADYVYSQINIANAEGELIDLNWLREQINNCFSRVKKTDNSLLVNHTRYIIDNANTRKVVGKNKIGLSPRTVKGYNTFLGMITRYQKVIKKQIHFQDINKPFVDRLVNWLINTETYATNTAGKFIENLKSVCSDAKNSGIQVNPYASQIKSFKEQNEDRHIVTLSFNELETIRTTKLESEALKNARNWLLVGCEIGQRASDLLRLTLENLRYEGGRVYMDIEQQKTGKYLSVGIIAPHVLEVLENNFPYQISTQKLNKHIKKVCQLAGLVEVIEGKKYNKEKKRKVFGQYPKWQLITSHSFRRSFATNYYKKIPTPVLIGITGHSKESMFLEYINRREDKDINADLFMKFYETIQQEKEPQLKVIKNAGNQN